MEQSCLKPCKETISTITLKGETKTEEGFVVLLEFGKKAKLTRKILSYEPIDLVADIGGILITIWFAIVALILFWFVCTEACLHLYICINLSKKIVANYKITSLLGSMGLMLGLSVVGIFNLFLEVCQFLSNKIRGINLYYTFKVTNFSFKLTWWFCWTLKFNGQICLLIFNKITDSSHWPNCDLEGCQYSGNMFL